MGGKKTMPELVEIAMNGMPGICKALGCTISFDIPGSGNTARLTVTPKDLHAPSDENWRFEVGVHAKDGSRLYSHFLFSGTKAETLAWAGKETARKSIVQSILELSDRADRD